MDILRNTDGPDMILLDQVDHELVIGIKDRAQSPDFVAYHSTYPVAYPVDQIDVDDLSQKLELRHTALAKFDTPPQEATAEQLAAQRREHGRRRLESIFTQSIINEITYYREVGRETYFAEFG